MADSYRSPESDPPSETEKVARQAEREMMAAFAGLLSVSDPREIGPFITRLDHLAHERCLAIRLEAHRRMWDFKPRSFVVTDEGLIVEASSPSGDDHRG